MVIKAKLLALKEDQNYITYVFQNLCDNSYIMCTRLPNWESPVINIDDVGYLNYKEVIGGETEWYHKETEKVKKLGLKISWGTTDENTNHSSLSASGERGYSSNGFGANRSDYS